MKLFVLSSLALATCFAASEQVPPCSSYGKKELETPCFTLLANSTSSSGFQYETRVYGTSPKFPEQWTQVSVPSSKFSDGEQEGFQANFNFISGQNSANRKIPMTSPVILRRNGTDGWLNSFFVPASLFPAGSKVPTSPQVQVVGMNSLKVVTAEFGGFATYEQFQTVEGNLRTALQEAGLTEVTGAFHVMYAQYDSPFTLFNRHNEVWIHVQ